MNLRQDVQRVRESNPCTSLERAYAFSRVRQDVQRVRESNPCTSLERAYAFSRVRSTVATLLLLFRPFTIADRKRLGAFTLISVAPCESVAFSFTVPNLSPKYFALPFSVF